MKIKTCVGIIGLFVGMVMLQGCQDDSVVVKYDEVYVCSYVDEIKGCIDDEKTFGHPKVIYATMKHKDGVKGDFFTAIWIDVDNNQKLKEASVTLMEREDPVLSFTLSHNMDKWIPGKYEVKIFKNDDENALSSNMFEVGVE
ncbi:hypothetical protein KKG71_04390 [Patescibacteria group bacterium]|nr:hypothetical protein [Patescibacteria group bacterium]